MDLDRHEGQVAIERRRTGPSLNPYGPGGRPPGLGPGPDPRQPRKSP
jgi:hypothetical protein